MFINISSYKGTVEFEEEKISLASITGPPSDISDRSVNSSGALNEHQKKTDGDGISLKSGNDSLQSGGGGGPLVTISENVGATGVLISTSTSPSPANPTIATSTLDSTMNLGGPVVSNTSGSSDMKGSSII